LLCRHDVAAPVKLLVKSAERPEDDETAINAVKCLGMLPKIVERKAVITPTAILLRKVYTSHLKRNEESASPG
jgi:hypothetical protein